MVLLDSNTVVYLSKEIISINDVFDNNETIAKRVIELKKEKKIKLPDAIICATAMVKDSLLITNDVRLKNIKKLKIKIVGV